VRKSPQNSQRLQHSATCTLVQFVRVYSSFRHTHPATASLCVSGSWLLRSPQSLTSVTTAPVRAGRAVRGCAIFWARVRATACSCQRVAFYCDVNLGVLHVMFFRCSQSQTSATASLNRQGMQLSRDSHRRTCVSAFRLPSTSASRTRNSQRTTSPAYGLSTAVKSFKIITHTYG
jgi:hypothetical protein